MGISGNLKTMVLAELLQWLSMGQKTGTLVIDNQKIKKKIFFEEGMIISSASTDPKEYLGRFLASHGFIPEDTVNEAVARQKEEKHLLGKILVNMGAISEEDLHQMLRLKAEESIYDIFTWEEGDFEFLDDQLPAETMIRMQLDVQGLVLEGTRRVDEWGRLRETIPSNLCVPVTVVDLDTVEEIDEINRQILAWVDDDRSVEEISTEAQISLFQVAEAVAEQVLKGRVKVVRPRTIEVRVEVPGAPAEAGLAGDSQIIHVHHQSPMMQAPMPYPQGQPPVQGYPQQPPVQGYPASSGVDMGSGRRLHFAAEGGATTSGGIPSMEASPPVQVSKAEELMQEAEAALYRGDFEDSLEKFRQAKSAEGANPALESASEAGESKVQEALERDGVGLSAVPKLKCGMDELGGIKISPQEGFMLTRVDGTYDIKSILKMSPMPKVDAQMLFWRLKKTGHVSL
jgi:hypothetical protein